MTANRAAWLRTYRQHMVAQRDLGKDTWIATHSPISAKRLHALGYITFVWNSVEHNLFSLFASVMQLPERQAWISCHDLGDIAISLRIREILAHRCSNSDFNILVENALDVYEICRKNRNLLTHFVIVAGGSYELSLYKPSRKPSTLASQPISDDLWDLRRVGRDIRRLNRRLQYLWCIYDHLNEGAPLLSKLLMPKSLWTPPPQVPKARKRRSQSSRRPQKSDDYA